MHCDALRCDAAGRLRRFGLLAMTSPFCDLELNGWFLSLGILRAVIYLVLPNPTSAWATHSSKQNKKGDHMCPSPTVAESPSSRIVMRHDQYARGSSSQHEVQWELVLCLPNIPVRCC